MLKGLLNEVLNKDIFLQFLNFCQTDLFDVIHLNKVKHKFRNSCQLFYKDKTKKDWKDFWTKTKISDSKRKINGQTCKSVSDLLKKLIGIIYQKAFHTISMVTCSQKILFIIIRNSF